jgi:hypothetical protein
LLQTAGARSAAREGACAPRIRATSVFRRIGKFFRRFSKHWKIWREFSQGLEVLGEKKPSLGKAVVAFSKAWKTVAAVSGWRL